MPNMEPPPLAVYRSFDDYVPMYSDFVIWSGWFRTWFGFVVDFDADAGRVGIAFEGTPQLLLTMRPDEIPQNTYLFNLDDIKRMKKGRWYVQQSGSGQDIWFI